MRARTNDESRTKLAVPFTSWLIGFAMGMAALGAVGFAQDEPLPSRPQTAPAVARAAAEDGPVVLAGPVTCREDEAAWSAALEGLQANLRLAAQVADLESALDALRAGALDGPSFVRSAVASMPEHEIAGVLAAATKLDAADLDAIEDLPGYAMRLAGIAMEGVLTDETEPVGVTEVVFSARQEGRRAGWSTADVFDRDEDRLYALFDTSGWESGEVMVRWRHVESGDVLLLERHRVRAGAERSFVWARPSRGWQAGAYRVDVYSGDEALGHLASGRYVVQ